MPGEIRDNKAQGRFETDAGGEVAVAYYTRTPGVITFTHTEVPFRLQGQGIASRLGRGALEAARGEGLKVVPRTLNRAPAVAVPVEEINPGDGFLMRHGWTVGWVGWHRSNAPIRAEPGRGASSPSGPSRCSGLRCARRTR